MVRSWDLCPRIPANASARKVSWVKIAKRLCSVVKTTEMGAMETVLLVAPSQMTAMIADVTAMMAGLEMSVVIAFHARSVQTAYPQVPWQKVIAVVLATMVGEGINAKNQFRVMTIAASRAQ